MPQPEFHVEDEDNSGFEPEALAAIQGAAPKKSMPKNIGHNSGATQPDAGALTQAARDKLKQIIARIERLEEEKREVASQSKDVYAEGKAMGYDPKTLRAVVRFRKQDRQEREEQQALLDTYLHALGELEFYD